MSEEVRFGEVDYHTAKTMVEQYHYSGCIPRGRNLCWGVWIGDSLYALAVYGNGVNSYQAGFLARTTGLPVTQTNHAELKRLVRTEPRHATFQLTQLIASAHRWLSNQGYKYIVSFSDPDRGHTGSIYRAANFAHLGHTQAEWHVVDSEGNQLHRRVAYRYSRRNDCTIEEARMALNLTRTKTSPRDRWFLALAKQDRRVMAELKQ